MRKQHLIGLFSIVCFFSITSCSREEPSEVMFEIKDFRNEWLVINYWASWCKPCVKEIPELNELYQSREDVTVVGVNYDGITGAELTRESLKLGIKFPNLSADPSLILETDRPIVLPTTMIVDKELKLRNRLIGPQTVESISFSIMEASKRLIQERTNNLKSP